MQKFVKLKIRAGSFEVLLQTYNDFAMIDVKMSLLSIFSLKNSICYVYLDNVAPVFYINSIKGCGDEVSCLPAKRNLNARSPVVLERPS